MIIEWDMDNDFFSSRIRIYDTGCSEIFMEKMKK
jgi:hypothetical protein